MSEPEYVEEITEAQRVQFRGFMFSEFKSYSDLAAAMFNVAAREVTPTQRRAAKHVALSAAYGRPN